MMWFQNYGRAEDSELLKIVRKSGAEVDLGCEMKTRKDGERMKDIGRVTALHTSENYEGEALVDMDFRKRKKFPTVTVAWKQEYKDKIPRDVFHDALSEFGIHAPSWNQQCILIKRESKEGDAYDATPSYMARCYGSGKDL